MSAGSASARIAPFDGEARFRDASAPQAVTTERVDATGRPADPAAPAPSGKSGNVDNRSLVLFDRGDEILVETRDEPVRFLLVSGRPLREPVAWLGPIVMNTEEELKEAFRQYRDGTFLDSPQSPAGE